MKVPSCYWSGRRPAGILLGKGGVAAPIKKKTRSLLSGRRRGGSFQPPIYRKLNEPPRPRFSKERGHLFDGAATPPLPRRGVPFRCFATFQVHCVFSATRVFCLPPLQLPNQFQPELNI